jgi:flavin reductase (DIM6/NTAB) family NADH-FMN oxidoreductase RutF
VIDSVTIAPTVYYFGTPVVLLSTLMPDGRTNLTPISSAWSLGSSYVLGLGSENQGTRNLLRTGEVVVNLPDASMAHRVEQIAPTTGAKPVPDSKKDRYRHEPDKWKLGGFTAVPSQSIAPARVADCPVQIEARVAEAMPLSEVGVAVHVSVVLTHAHEALVIPDTSYIDLERWRPLYYTFRHYYAQGEQVAVSFKAEQ